MNKKQAYIFLAITGALTILIVLLAVYWFDFKLAIIIVLMMLVMAANNLQMPDRWK